MISTFCKALSPNTADGDGHQLIENQEFELELHHIAEDLDRVTDTDLIKVDEGYSQDIQANHDNVDVDEINHHTPLFDARFQLQELS